SDGYRPSVLAVTGTNGKTTVTALTTALINAAGRRACAAGNIGPAALDALVSALEAGELPEVWVLELSSFQLETVSSLRVAAAAVLNLSEDHLDWHRDIDAYAQAKARIFKGADLAVVNRGAARVAAMVPGLHGLAVRSLGPAEPARAGDLGSDVSHGPASVSRAARARSW